MDKNSATMKLKGMITAVLALMLSVGAYAQTQPPVHKMKPRRSPAEREAHRQEMKAKLDQMTPAERKAFKQAHREQRQARLNAMTPEQRERFMQRREQRKALKQRQG